MTSGKTYSAGTIFLQVVPVFRDVQDTIKKQAKDWNRAVGDEMEKGGEEAGERAAKAVAKGMEKGSAEAGKRAATEFQKRFHAGVKDMQSALEPIDLRLEDKNIKKQFAEINKDLDALDKRAEQGFVYEADIRDAEKKFRILHSQLEGLRNDVRMTATLDVDKTLGPARKLEGLFDSLKKAAEIEMRFEGKQAERAVGAFEKKVRASAKRAAEALGEPVDAELKKIKSRLEAIGDVEIGIDMSSAQVEKEIDDLLSKAKRLAMTSVDIEVRTNAAVVEAELTGVAAAARRLDGKNIKLKADVDAGAAVAKMGMLHALFMPGADGAMAAANSFRSFRAIILAVAATLPALIPMVGALGGALLGLIPILAAVGGGFTAMLVGFSGIGDAVGALGDQANDAAKDSYAAGKTMQAASYAVADAKQALADAERNAAQASADAARAVADARRAAADAVEDALDRQRDAQEAYADAVDEVRDAEQNLRDARKRAQQEQADNADKLRQNALDIREAQLAAFDATNHFNAVMADGSSTAYDKEAAEVAMLQARERLHELRDDQVELREEQEKGPKTDAVESAQERLEEALERQKDAQEAVGEAAEAVAEARIEGARRVADAIRAQQRAEADGARNVARAQEQLRRANESYGQALYETGELGSASAQKVEEAMGKLGPAGQRFARFLHGLRDEFYQFRNAIQEGMLPGVQRAMEALIAAYGPQFTAFMAQMGTGVGMFFESLAASLQGPAWKGFFASIRDLGPSMMASTGQGFLSFMEAMASILTAVAPFAERLARGIASVMDSFARWAASKDGQEGITRFMEYAERVGPKVIDFIVAFAKGATNIAKALAPWGEMVLDALTGVLNWIASLDPKTLGVILGLLTGMVVVFMAAVGVTALFLGGMSAMAIPASKFILLFGGLIITLAVMALRFETVSDVLGWLRDQFKGSSDTLIDFAKAIGAVMLAWKIYKAVAGTIRGIQLGIAAASYGAAGATYAQGAAATFTYKAMRIWAAVTKVMTIVQLLFNKALRANPLVRIALLLVALGAAVVFAYKKFPAFRRIVDKVFKAVGKAAVWVGQTLGKIFGWINTNVLQPLGRAFVWLWDKAIKPALGFIVAYWKAVFGAMQTVWKNILWPILDLIFTLIWKLAIGGFKLALAGIKLWWKSTMDGLKWVWRNVLKPVLDAIGRALKWLWEKVGKPIFGFLKRGFQGLGDAFRLVWNKVLKPMFDAFIEMLGGKQGIKKKFETVVSAIKSLWDGLKKIIGEPIKFVINTVIRDGLVKGFNKVAKFVGSSEMKFDGVDWEFASGGVFPGRRKPAYATGGVLPGYTPGSDVHHFTSPSGGRLHLSGGEAIMRPEFTAAMGEGWVNYMNSLARAEGPRGIRRRMLGADQGYFMGGVLPLPGARVARHTSGYSSSVWAGDLNVGSGADDYGMPIRAWKSGMIALMRYLGDRSYGRYMDINHDAGQSSRYAHMSAFAAGLRQGLLVTQGQTIGYVGNEGNSSAPHLHFEVNGGVPLSSGAGDTGGGGIGNPLAKFPGWLVKVAKNPLGYVKGLVSKPLDAMKEKFHQSEMLKNITAIPGKVVRATAGKIRSFLPGPLRLLSNSASLGAEIAGNVADGVTGAVGAAGDALGFRRGGVLPYNGTMMYDSGGYLPPGITNVVNLTGKPEPVFTNDQFQKMGSGGGADGITYAPTFNGTDLTADDIIDDFEFTIRKMRKGGKYQGAGK